MLLPYLDSRTLNMFAIIAFATDTQSDISVSDSMFFDENGQGVIEYLILGVLALVIGGLIYSRYTQQVEDKVDTMEGLWPI